MSTKFILTTIIILTVASSSLTSCKSYDVASRYSAKYINANAGKVTAQVPETFELGYVMLALTDAAQNDTAIVNHNSAYYNEVMAKFGKFKNLKGVQHLNADLKRNPKLIKSYLDGLYALQMNDSRVVLKTNYRIDLNKVNFTRYALLLEDLYKDAAFHDFYMEHQSLYAQMIQKANVQFNYTEVQKKLSANVKGYQIILSPLTNAYAGTMEIKGHAYSEYIVFPRMATDGRSYAINQDHKKINAAE